MEPNKTIDTATICNELRNRILCLQYKPGRGLSTAILAKELRVSRSPIRESLLLLASSGFVELFPKSGSRVALIDLDKAENERFLRKSIELFAIPIFAANRTNENLKEMYVYLDKQKQCQRNGDFLNLLKYDDLFHQVIFKGIGKLDVWRLVRNSSPNDFRIRLLTFGMIDSFPFSILENHEDIVHAAEKRDGKLARTIMESHLTRNESDISKITFQLPEIFTSTNTPNNFTNIRTYSDGIDDYYSSILHHAKKV